MSTPMPLGSLPPVPASPSWEVCKAQLEKWLRFAESRREEHKTSIGWRYFWGTLLGIPTTMLSTIVGTAVFATWQNEQPDATARWWIAGISLLAALFSGLQAFFRFNERAGRHQALADKAHALCTQIELLLCCPPKQEELPETMAHIKDHVSGLGVEASAKSSLKQVVGRG